MLCALWKSLLTGTQPHRCTSGEQRPPTRGCRCWLEQPLSTGHCAKCQVDHAPLSLQHLLCKVLQQPNQKSRKKESRPFRDQARHIGPSRLLGNAHGHVCIACCTSDIHQQTKGSSTLVLVACAFASSSLVLSYLDFFSKELIIYFFPLMDRSFSIACLKL